MARKYPKRRSDPPLRTAGSRGFPLGLNQLTHPTTIQDTELAEAQNVFYSQNGVLSKRPGTTNIGDPRGSSTSITALGAAYSIGTPATDYLLRISDDGILQKYSFTSESWVDVSGSPTFSNVETQILQAYGFVYILNDTDNITKWNGTSFTSFTNIANPLTPPTVTKNGSGRVITVNIGSGGSGYSVGNVLTVSTGDANCTLLVASVSSGAVTSVTIQNAGTGYSVSTGQATTVAPSGGTGCTINVTKVEGVGATTYYYRYVWYNSVGNTLASSSSSVSNMPATLDASTYVTVALSTAPAGVERVGIFRGTVSGEEVFIASIPAAETTYYDKFFDEEDPLYGIPESNTTVGFHFKFATVYRDTLIGVTVELGDHTLVFSAGGDKFDSFGRADGGGYYAWRKDDGDPMTAVHAFQDELYVFKRGKIGAFTFDENGGSVKDINLAVGAVSHRSVHAAGNDLRFWGQDGAGSLGNEPNFANIIRTKVLSARADTIVQSLTPAAFDQISGIYYKGLSLWGIPLGTVGEGITSTLVYDEKYVAWSEWVGMTPRLWTKFIDDENKERLFYGDSKSGNIVECWDGTSDNGNPIVWRVATKQFDMGKPHKYKKIVRIYYIFGNVSGRDTSITLVEDGQRSQIPFELYSDTGNVGFGVDQWGMEEFGESSGTFTGDTSGLMVRYIDVNKDLFSIQSVLQNDGVDDQIKFMGKFIEYRDSAKPLPSTMRLRRAS